ncbi:MAG: sugar transporter [Sphingobacteriaceae bacterium]|jgi:DsbC/DsbD-like thiol-disulfide interchange protein|nr:sugar transporter [Sphingobacteriaceae bacterium]
MKKFSLMIIALLLAGSSFAQILKPVKWSYAAKRTSATEAVVFIKATIDKGWHIYSQNTGDGPVATSFTFAPSKSYTLVGKASEPKPITKFEKSFGSNVSYFEDVVIFQQKVKLKSAAATSVKGSLEFMVCNESKCLPPDEVEFTIPIKVAGK